MKEQDSLDNKAGARAEIKAAVDDKSRLLWIDFLRGIAAYGVVLFHSPVFFWVGLSAINAQPANFSVFDHLLAYLSIPFHFTGSGVMLFFVLSGFCIHYPYAVIDKKLFLPSYAVRRFLRIYPPYLCAVIFAVVCEQIAFYYFGKPASTWPKAIESIFMLQNYVKPNGQLLSDAALWSLPVEVELYILYPIFYFFLRSIKALPTMAIVTIVSAGALALSMTGNIIVTENCALYWTVWCSGALLAEWVRKDKLPDWKLSYTLTMLIGFCLSIACTVLKFKVSICNLAWSLSYFMLVWWGLSNHEQLAWLKGEKAKPFLFLGLISYSLYLFHCPFFYLFRSIWLQVAGTKPTSYLVAIAFSILAVIPAYLSYRFVEAPSHNLGRRISSWLESQSSNA